MAFALENREVFGEMAQTVQFNFMDMNLENGEDIRISNENVDCRMNKRQSTFSSVSNLVVVYFAVSEFTHHYFS